MDRTVVLVAVLPFLLAGCDRPETGIGPPYTEGRSSILQGIFANATLYKEPDGSYRMEVLAENRGETAYRISNVCVPPWTDAMETKDGQRVDHRAPVGSCAAFGLGPFPPGARQEATFDWDGQLWQDDDPRDAPPGTYFWNAVFEFFDEGSGVAFERRDHVALQFEVMVD